MKFIPQHDQMDCGPACLAMIVAHYGKDISIQYLRERSYITREGVSLQGLSEAADEIGFETVAAKLNTSDLQENIFPCILHWRQNHFVVLKKKRKKLITRKTIYKIADPGHGIISLSEDMFEKYWISEKDKGIAFILNPTEKFHNGYIPRHEGLSFNKLLSYLKPHKKQIIKMCFLLLLGTLTSLVFPILTQKLIDEGVSAKNYSVISYILLAQLAFFLGNIIFSIFRNWIILVVGTKINIKIISDFLKKILNLPISFFDTKLIGDFNQRIQDHERIETFLTSQSLLTIFSIITFTVFFGILYIYDYKILLVYSFLTTISIVWSIYWMKKIKILDYFRFQQGSENQETIYEMINGVTEMKLNQFEDFKRKEWENIQLKLFEVNTRILKIDQIQMSGFEFINQFKNILVTFISAILVVKDIMTLGELLSVSYIIGQMNSPVNQLVVFSRSLQDAKLSFSRLDEVQNQEDEEKIEHITLSNTDHIIQNSKSNGIYLKNLSFQYEGPQSNYVIKNLNFCIPEGKVTAIVGASGSGKTTLIKILLKFYKNIEGDVFFNNLNLNDLSPLDLRKNSGVVMQDGFIFSDTIERNIVAGDENVNYDKLYNALEVANLKTFIDQLPLGLNTNIGSSGKGISGGQKQRILIARAVYKDPKYLFLDEATSALDSENEKIIHDNLHLFFKGKTVIIIAHRLSTVKNADQIIVLKNGEMLEQGNHEKLVTLRGEYYNLVKNQLELGN